MEIILQGRQTGRTQTLIRECHAAEVRGETSYIVCHSQEEAYRIVQMSIEMGLPVPFPITFDEFLGNHYAGQNIKHFLIDNADWLLRRLTHVPISIITMEKKSAE